MHAAILYVVLTLASFNGAGRATTFDHPSRDPWNTMGSTTHLACVSHARPTPHARAYIDSGMIVAHKTIPCYSEITVCNPRTKRCVDAMVADWGPVHASIDLYAPLSRRLQHNGDEPVVWLDKHKLAQYAVPIM